MLSVRDVDTAASKQFNYGDESHVPMPQLEMHGNAASIRIGGFKAHTQQRN